MKKNVNDSAETEYWHAPFPQKLQVIQALTTSPSPTVYTMQGDTEICIVLSHKQKEDL